ncbi:MAG: xanthine dehydrogenase family protein molybdopterin-binding subunit, partial [Vulcanimicrobiaceae bacterium]
VDAVDRVTGRANYVANVELPGMLHAKLLRSIVPHAKIVRIDASKARELAGVHAVITGADIAARTDVYPTFGPVLRDQPILAIDRVRYIGEPIATVAAETTIIAQKALELIDVEYDELPAVFDEHTALENGVPLLHPDPPRGGETFADLVFSREQQSNICAHFKLRRGDVERAFAEAAHVFEDEFRCPAVQHVSLEPHVCVADVTDGRITVWATSQTPHQLRAQLADALKQPLSKVRVLVTTLGGGYGGKAHATIEPAIVLLAMAARRPVKCALTREEEFVTISKHAATIRSKVGLDREGKILARKIALHFNTGAYAQIGPRVIQNGGHPSAGPYHTPNACVDSYAVYT